MLSILLEFSFTVRDTNEGSFGLYFLNINYF